MADPVKRVEPIVLVVGAAAAAMLGAEADQGSGAPDFGVE
jgi:hypothetical protein